LDENLTIVAVLIVLISVIIPFLENYLRNRNEKIKTECLLVANNHQWISIEEIAELVGVSIRIAIKYVVRGINEKIIIGSFENNMFARSHERTYEEIVFSMPYEQDEF